MINCCQVKKIRGALTSSPSRFWLNDIQSELKKQWRDMSAVSCLRGCFQENVFI